MVIMSVLTENAPFSFEYNEIPCFRLAFSYKGPWADTLYPHSEAQSHSSRFKDTTRPKVPVSISFPLCFSHQCKYILHPYNLRSMIIKVKKKGIKSVQKY